MKPGHVVDHIGERLPFKRMSVSSEGMEHLERNQCVVEKNLKNLSVEETG